MQPAEATLPTEHSPLGGSGAHRFLACPRSVQLSRGIVESESEHAALGTAAHALGERCIKTGRDPWEFIGGKAKGIEIDKDMADAVHVYTSFARSARDDANQGNRWVELPFHCPDLHPLYYSTADLVDLYEDRRHLEITDYKHGAGIVVEAENNAQLMMYACGVLEHLGLWQSVLTVTMRIVQPRGFHFDGPIREHTMPVADLRAWLYDVLLPGMEATKAADAPTASGDHCRFCPARSHACPQLMEDMEELETMVERVNEAGGAGELTNEEVGRFLNLLELAKIVGKAASETAFARMQNGQSVPGYKLSAARTNREWKEGAEKALRRKFGDKVYTEPKLKSPAEIDKLPEGSKLTAEWAFKPDGGLTVTKATDARPAVNKDTKSLFKPVKKGKSNG